MKYIRIENNKIKQVSLPPVYKSVINYQIREDLHEADGFIKINYPVKTENQKYVELTVEEIESGLRDTKIIDLTDDEILAKETKEKKELRNQLLKEGVIVQNIWFNELLLTQFTVMAQMCYTSNVLSFEWGKEDGWGTVTIDEAFEIVKEASSEFSQIYKDHVL